jgi:hypothetical protein
MIRLCQTCTVHYTETEFVYECQSVMITFVTSVKNKQKPLYVVVTSVASAMGNIDLCVITMFRH